MNGIAGFDRDAVFLCTRLARYDLFEAMKATVGEHESPGREVSEPARAARYIMGTTTTRARETVRGLWSLPLTGGTTQWN